jgi:hypothetical protein
LNDLSGLTTAATSNPLLQCELGCLDGLTLMPVRNDTEIVGQLAGNCDQCQTTGSPLDLSVGAKFDHMGAKGLDRRIDGVGNLVDAGINDFLQERGTSGSVKLFRRTNDLISKTGSTILTRARVVERAKSLTAVGRDIEDPNLLTSTCAAIAVFFNFGCERDLAGRNNHHPPRGRRAR